MRDACISTSPRGANRLRIIGWGKKKAVTYSIDGENILAYICVRMKVLISILVSLHLYCPYRKSLETHSIIKEHNMLVKVKVLLPVDDGARFDESVPLFLGCHGRLLLHGWRVMAVFGCPIRIEFSTSPVRHHPFTFHLRSEYPRNNTPDCRTADPIFQWWKSYKTSRSVMSQPLAGLPQHSTVGVPSSQALRHALDPCRPHVNTVGELP